MKPEITLGLPTYKGSLHIKESLESIVNQTFRNFHLIISINGIDEDTHIICCEFAKNDSRIKIVNNQRVLSIWENWTVPITQCTTEMFMWVSDDDILPPDYLDNIYRIFLENNSKALVYGKFVEFEKFPQSTNHKGNGLIYNFLGNSLFRKLKFLLLDPGYGKVNGLYGLGKIEWFQYAINLNTNKSEIYDVGFLFDILDVCEIRFSDNSHFRRKFIREIVDKNWSINDLYIFSDLNAFNLTIKNSKLKIRLLCYLFFPIVISRSILKTSFHLIK